MFKELAPLLRHRAVLFTVTHVEEGHFRVNVIPKKVTEADNDALTTPVIRNVDRFRSDGRPDHEVRVTSAGRSTVALPGPASVV